MRGAQALVGVLAVVASLWLLRVVVHAYTDHAHLDVFHLVVGLTAAAAGGLILRRSLRAGRA